MSAGAVAAGGEGPTAPRKSVSAGAWGPAIQDAGMGKRSAKDAASALDAEEAVLSAALDGSGLPTPSAEMAVFAKKMRDDFTRMMMEYQFAIDEVLTKVTILREEYLHLQKYNPIEHVTSRVKSVESILDKMARRGVAPTVEDIRANIFDIAGIRITCSFIADTYRMMDALASQDDIKVVQVKDYIATPKPNGYKSLHAIIEIPVFLSTGPIRVPVEVQIRTIAMDFWASLEHKIFYKYKGDVPTHLVEELTEAAHAAEDLDRRMEQLHRRVHGEAPVEESERRVPELNIAALKELWVRAQEVRN